MPEDTNTEGLSREEIHDWLRTHFPRYESTMRLEEAGGGRARVRYLVTDQHLRPGGTVMGPILMLVADTAMYAALISLDRRTTAAFTSNLNISFLQRPAPRDLIGEAEVLRLGRSLSVGEVRMYSDGDDRIVAHATVTFSHR
jgi:uncharacterized protein (TIGR00369 family)